jgi:hypothetical protein
MLGAKKVCTALRNSFNAQSVAFPPATVRIDLSTNAVWLSLPEDIDDGVEFGDPIVCPL